MDRFVTYFYGSLAWLTGLILYARTLDGRISPSSTLHIRAIETNPASQNLTWHTRKGNAVTMPREYSHIVKARTKAEMIAATRSSPSTRFFAERLAALPDDFTTADGSGAVMVPGFLAGELDPELADFLERPIIDAADQNTIRRAVERGQITQAPARPIIVRDVINGGGASQILAAAAAIRRQRFAASRGIPVQSHLLIIDPALSGATGSPARADAERNFVINARMAHALVEKWRDMALPTFRGYLRPTGAVWTSIMLYQPANTVVSVGGRPDAAEAIARVLDLFSSEYAAHADASFTDGKKDAAAHKTPMPVTSVGFWMRRLFPEWAELRAMAALERAISRIALGTSR